MVIMNDEGRELHLTVRGNAVRMSMHHRIGQNWIDVTVPPGCGERELRAFLRKNRGWIDAELSREAPGGFRPALAAGERAWLLGEQVTLGEGGIPAGGAFLELRARRLHDEVVRILPAWQQRMGVRASVIRWRDMTSRWGSCQTVTRAVTLNLRLGAMPPECIEYVLVHELCHLIHPDHSPAFHREMTRFLPDWKERKHRLDHYGPLILPPAGQGEEK